MVSSGKLVMGAALAVLAGAIAAPAMAQPISGVYVGGGVGLNLRHGTTAEPPFTRNLSEPGVVGLAAVGWGYGNGLRVEAEASYRSNEVRDLRFVRNGELANNPDVQGRTGTAALMLNLLYDFDLRRWGISVRPYIGGGIGYGWRDYDGVSASTPFVVATPTGFVTGPGRTSLRGSYGDFAWQAIGGVAIPLRFVPGLELTAEYRYFSMDGTKFEARQTLGFTNPNPGGTQSNRRFGRDDNHNHAALIGLRYAFNTPRPAPVAAVAPVPQAAPVARTYLVFFDWDRADLTDRARQIIADAAANARNTRSTRIEVSGHADRSGTPQYNQRLSQRRAEAVAAELVRQGVSRNEIGVQAFGESRPLVPTADNVREPQNRRVEIVLR
jgi:outer membrane protein OmpA-like peptidoglycan-associated protein